MSISVVWS